MAKLSARTLEKKMEPTAAPLIPSADDERAALADLLQKGMIDESQYRKKLTDLQQKRMMQVILLKGGYRPKRKGQKRMKLEEMRHESLKQQTLGLKDRIMEETRKKLEELDSKASAEP